MRTHKELLDLLKQAEQVKAANGTSFKDFAVSKGIDPNDLYQVKSRMNQQTSKTRLHATLDEKTATLRKFDALIAQGHNTSEASTKVGRTLTTIRAWQKSLGEAPMENAREIQTLSTNHKEEWKQLKIENQRLRLIVSDQALDIQALKEYAGRK